jgi:hypothetical protein
MEQQTHYFTIVRDYKQQYCNRTSGEKQAKERMRLPGILQVDGEPDRLFVPVGIVRLKLKEKKQEETEREVILDDIRAIKEKENGFSRTLQKWVNCYKYDKSGAAIHISEFDFEQLSPLKLIFFYKMVLKKHNSQ